MEHLESKQSLLIDQYENKLSEIESIDISEYDLEKIQELCYSLEVEMETLNSRTSSILPDKIRVSIKQDYMSYIHKYKELLRMIYSYYDLLDKTEVQVKDFSEKLSDAMVQLELLKSNIHLGNFIKKSFEQRFISKVKDLTKEVTDRLLPVEFRDSIDLITKTLEEPELFSLPHLIMWRETAEEKIEKLRKIEVSNIPQLVDRNNRYIQDSNRATESRDS